MAKQKLTIVERIKSQKIADALGQQVNVIAAHLDLEGVAYVKITRTGPQACFAADETSTILGGGEGETERYKKMAALWWIKPAMEKFGQQVDA